jgi:quercetin 2,3-dioxygenase
MASSSGWRSPSAPDTAHRRSSLVLRDGRCTVPLRPAFEYGLVVLEGAFSISNEAVRPGHLAYLGRGRDELELSATGSSRALLLGGEPFGERILMWWNFVARTPEEMQAAYTAWQADDGRFGRVDSPLPRIPAPEPSWSARR